MFKNWGAWLGTDKEAKEESCSVVNDDQQPDVNKAAAAVGEEADATEVLEKAKGWRGWPQTHTNRVGYLILQTDYMFLLLYINATLCLTLDAVFRCFLREDVKLQ